MKKPLHENTAVALQALNRTRLYHPTNLALQTDYGSATRVAGGTLSVISRSPGPALPEKEKPYRRSFQSAVRFNGDMAWWYRSGNTRVSIGRITGVFSNLTGSAPSFLVVPDGLPSVPTAVSAFFSRYSIAIPPVKLDYRSQAEVKAMNKLRGEASLSDLNIGVLWGERRETCQLIESLLTGTWAVMRSCATRDYKKAAQELRETFSVKATAKGEALRMRKVERRLKKELGKAPSLAQRAVAGGENAILAYNLGITPLVNDVKAAVKSLTELDPVTNSDIKVESQYSRTIDDEISWWVDTDSRDRTAEIHVTAVETHGYNVVLRAAPRWDTWTLLSRLGIADLNLAWELTRLSFLVDYYAAVGPWLSALNARREFEWIDGSYTQRYILNLRAKGKSTLLGGGSASGYGVVNHTQRRVYGSMPFPFPPMSLRHRNLSSKDAQDAESKRALNQAALASRAIRDAMSGIFT